MESITKFSLPEVSYKCSLNPRGRRRYGTLEELLHTKTGVPSTVGFPDGSTYERPDIRSSLKYTSVVEFDLNPQEINNHIQTLLPEDSRSLWSLSQKYDVLVYSTGGFFREHSDKKLHKNHFGTLLLFPPAVGDFAHTGGELLLDGGKFVFESSLNDCWTFIAFKAHLPHECKEVLSGKRVVFKTELYCTRNTPEIEFSPQVVDGGIHRFHFREPSPEITD